MSNIQTLQQQRAALEAQINESRTAAINEVRGIMQSFGIKSWELVDGGKRPGRPAKVQAQPSDCVSMETDIAPSSEPVSKPAKGKNKGGKGKVEKQAQSAGEPAEM